ncbi:acetyltransferase [Vibrio sp. 1CM8B]|uniref:acetyltransferase n=1 Tax=Vibrio sp. 1CM8B TaxID=2929167 RepID=UPI0020BE07FB|nr:acetyltransferase [Vibrio sp. 1CM8B]MCK8087064.1 acetyltransferase [Vibrio sp. 1CM8B]
MKNLVFVGGGGYFIELLDYIKKDIVSGVIPCIQIKGVIDDKDLGDYCPIDYLGTLDKYIVSSCDVFIIAIGSVNYRQSIYLSLKERGADFFTYIHPTAIVAKSASVGEGTIVCPFSIINATANVGANVSINVHASVGHEAQVGEHCVISPYAALNGNAKVGAQTFLGTRSTIFPGVSIGNQNIIDSHTAVRKSAGDKLIISERAKYSVVENRFIR